MGKSKHKTDKMLQTQPGQKMEIFSFGEPVPVMDKSEILSYLSCTLQFSKWYAPPLSFDGLAKSLRASTHHESAISVKVNLLADTCVITRPNVLSHTDLTAFIKDFYVFGNAYFNRIDNRLGDVLRLEKPLAKYVRKGREVGQYFYLCGGQEHEFETHSVFHLLEPDINQNIYGLPQYLSALQSAWLNESATLFRRKYYINGAHAGFVFYMTDAAQKQEDIDNLREQLRKSKGVGNFKNLFVHAPSGKKDGIQIIPIADVAAKDEFFNIKNVTRDDVLAAHRVPPQLMGIVPNNTGGFGDVEKAAKVFIGIEIAPMQQRLLEINRWLGFELIKFKPSILLE